LSVGISHGDAKNLWYSMPAGIPPRSAHACTKQPDRFSDSDTRASAYSASSWRCRLGHGQDCPHAVCEHRADVPEVAEALRKAGVE